MSDLLPLFPLPNVVLFPNVFLPLHVFEPRYRELVTDTLAADRMIGIVLLKPGWQSDYEGCPAIYPIGCSGVITHVERIADGRFNIVLRGLERVRVLEEDRVRANRRALVEPLGEGEIGPKERDALRQHRAKIEALLAPAVEGTRGLRTETGEPRGPDPTIPSAMPDEDLVNALAQYLDLEPLEKQALLEQSGLCARAESLVELLEMKILMARTPGMPAMPH
jgi:Lon protease-like protein